MFLATHNDAYTGKYLKVQNNSLLNFGTCGYLGLESDQRLITGATEYSQRFGTQFSVSRAYLDANYTIALEELISQMYSYPATIMSSTSTCHLSIIPTLVRENDWIILDQSVHMSIQTASQLSRQRGVPIDMIRHNNLEMLERKIKESGAKYRKIWYMIDGVYSMYGEIAPMVELVELLNKYHNLYLYIDDAHGMSWYGKNGTGFVFGKVGMHPKMILITTMAKGFGVTGGIAVFPDVETQRKVTVFGGPLSYSHPVAPPIIGAAVASAKIHLSNEIIERQAAVQKRISLCADLLAQTRLPVISDASTPIFFVAVGQLRLGHNLVHRMLSRGFYVNLALFPAVPVKNTGIRFTINYHQNPEDIKKLVQVMEEEFFKALAEENISLNQVRKAFRLPMAKDYSSAPEKITIYLKMQYETTISNIDAEVWDECLADQGSFDHKALLLMEDIFSGNELPEQNWLFHYFLVRDKQQKVILATFFTEGIFKDDFLSLESISRQIESKRSKDPYHLVSKALMMGSLFTEGNHLYLDINHKNWQDAFHLLLNKVAVLSEKVKANHIFLRDFDKQDLVIKDFVFNEGFVAIDMPNTNIINDLSWQDESEYLQSLNGKQRQKIRKEVLKYADRFEVEIKERVSVKDAAHIYQLYQQVKQRNFGVNFFDYPPDIVEKLFQHPGWEFIMLYLKDPYDNREQRLPVSVSWCYKGTVNYCPMILGMDYTFAFEHKVYKQSLYQVVLRARELNKKHIYFGLSADTDKKKFGALQYPRVAYVQSKDNYNWELIESMSAAVNH